MPGFLTLESACAVDWHGNRWFLSARRRSAWSGLPRGVPGPGRLWSTVRVRWQSPVCRQQRMAEWARLRRARTTGDSARARIFPIQRSLHFPPGRVTEGSKRAAWRRKSCMTAKTSLRARYDSLHLPQGASRKRYRKPAHQHGVWCRPIARSVRQWFKTRAPRTLPGMCRPRAPAGSRPCTARTPGNLSPRRRRYVPAIVPGCQGCPRCRPRRWRRRTAGHAAIGTFCPRFRTTEPSRRAARYGKSGCRVCVLA